MAKVSNYKRVSMFKAEKEKVEKLIQSEVPRVIGNLMSNCTIPYIAEKCEKSASYINFIKSGKTKCSVDCYLKLKDLEKLEC